MALPLISVIIPAYNTSSYLNRCLESVCMQTFSNLEILLINDGSTDSTGELCEEWQKKDKRISYIYQHNQGLAEVCNVGVNAAKGEFIGFVDSDDWIAPTMFNELFRSLQKHNTDIAFCGVLLESEDGRVLKRRGCKKERVDDGKTALINLLIDKKEKNYRWNKLYRKEVFEGIIFPKGRVFEDLNTVYKLYANARSISYVGKNLYHYIQRPESIIGTKNINREIDFFTANAERYDFIKKYPDFSKREREMLQIRTTKRLLSSAHKIYKMTMKSQSQSQKNIIAEHMTKIYGNNFNIDKYNQYVIQIFFQSLPYLNIL